MRWPALLAALAGCGRLGFDPAARVEDGAIDMPSAPCTAMFCDGFEDAALSAWGVLVENGSSADRVPSGGFRGAALSAVGPIGSSIAARFVDVFPATPPPPAEQWVRVYIYASSADMLDLEPIALTDPTQSYQIVMGLFGDTANIHAHAIAGDFQVLDDATKMPRDRWVCFELRVAIDVVGVVELYRDGALLLSSGPVDTRPPAMGLPRVLVGIASKPDDKVQAIQIDEVAADTKQIGCL